MPARLIRDDLLESEAVLSLPVEARWLYVSILLSADDVGLFEATPFKLARRADLRRELVDRLLSMLVDADLIRLYAGAGARTFGFVPKFRQRLQIKRARYPLPPAALVADDADALNKINHLRSEITVDHGDPRKSTVGQPPEPEPEPEQKVSNPSGSHPPGGGEAPPKAAKAKKAPKPAQTAFDAFWTAWPKSERKQDKAKCLAHWKLHELDGCAEVILADLSVKRLTRKWQDGFIEAPLVYLRGKRWGDGVTPDGADPGAAVRPWWDSRAGIEAKGVELGIGAWDQAKAEVGQGIQWPVYRARVYAAAGHVPREAAHDA